MGIIKWIFTEEPIDDLQIKEVGTSFGFHLPDDYKQCIKQNNGGFPEPNIFDCDDGRIEAVFNNLISFSNKDLNIKMLYEFLSQKLFPFGKDPFGNLLCFNYQINEKSPKVVYYDYEDKTITPVCDSFAGLLDRLYSL